MVHRQIDLLYVHIFEAGMEVRVLSSVGKNMRR